MSTALFRQMEKIRSVMELSEAYYDTPEKIADAALTRIMHAKQSSDRVAELVEAARDALLHFHLSHRRLELTVGKIDDCPNSVCDRLNNALAHFKD